ncbi:hypothetical protein [Coleofasciculus sp. E1-EBD-02]|uniref:hypothetical protein n=1 Tax=Coleofasciculus sp. E1-EBD-02 TaxID=3068481 RepID=UPI0032F55C5E
MPTTMPVSAIHIKVAYTYSDFRFVETCHGASGSQGIRERFYVCVAAVSTAQLYNVWLNPLCQKVGRV